MSTTDDALEAARKHRQDARRALASQAPTLAMAQALMGILECQIALLESGPMAEAAAELADVITGGLIPPPVADGGRWAPAARRCPTPEGSACNCTGVCLMGC